MADEYGVNKSSYDPVLLPNIKAYQVTCKALGSPNEVLDLGTEAIPKELEWGEVRICNAHLCLRGLSVSPQVLVHIQAAPINPGDLYNVRMGSIPYTVRRCAAAPNRLAPPLKPSLSAPPPSTSRTSCERRSTPATTAWASS